MWCDATRAFYAYALPALCFMAILCYLGQKKVYSHRIYCCRSVSDANPIAEYAPWTRVPWRCKMERSRSRRASRPSTGTDPDAACASRLLHVFYFAHQQNRNLKCTSSLLFSLLKNVQVRHFEFHTKMGMPLVHLDDAQNED